MVISDNMPARAREILTQFQISDDKLRQISENMFADFTLGLEKGTPQSSTPMLPTFLPALPDGSESGRYLAMDLSGTTLRISLFAFSGHLTPPEVQNHNFIVTTEVMTGTKTELFDFIARCLAKFLSENNLLDANLPLGFVFSYPCEQKSLRSASLLWWTKGFNVTAVIGEDVVRLLEEAIARHGNMKVRVKAIMNDTVGQLVASAYLHGPDCCIGVVVGNGCNASYVERVENIRKFTASSHSYTHTQMVIDTEWEDFGNAGQLDDVLNEFDREIDAASMHKARQRIDKLAGALFLGELVRRVLEQLTVDGVIFGGKLTDELQTPQRFHAKYLSEILSDGDDETAPYKNTRRIIDELQIQNHNTADYLLMREVCNAVSMRAAGVVAAALSALMRVTKRTKIVVGLGGTIYQYHTTFHKLLEAKVADIAPKGIHWQLVPVADGSCRGAALVAAVAEKLNLS